MPEKRNFSRTMRIDLIPEVPSEPHAGQVKRVIISGVSSAHASEREAAALDGTSRYEELFQSVYDAAVVSDLKGTIVDVNVRAIEFLLYERAEICGLSIIDVISGADASLMGTLIDSLEHERFAVIQAYCIRQDGSQFPSEIAVNKLRLGTMHLCFFIRDITLRKQAEEMLITEHNAIQNAGNGIAVANLDMQLEYANPATAVMWGYECAESLLGADVRGLFRDREAASELVATLKRKGQGWVHELKAWRRDDVEFDVQVSAACSRNSDGELVGLVFSFVDISDRKRAEDAERESARRRVMLESLGAACHHLGQPATVLLANLGILRSELADAKPTTKELVQGSLDAVDRLGKILHKLNAVNEYKTMQYLPGNMASGSESRILDI